MEHRIERHRKSHRETEEFLHAMREEQEARDDAQQRIGLFAETIQKLHDRSPSCPKTRSEEHTSELQSLMRISYAVFCLQKKKNNQYAHIHKNKPLKHNTQRQICIQNQPHT